jgi:predicted nucleic acid-binding protein
VHRLQLVLLDEKRARTCAESLGLVPRGVLGILARARRESLIPELRGSIQALIEADFRLPLDAVNAQLVALGEDPVGPED